ncbi:MAG: cobalamin biosynthesis protein P47K [Rhodopirellula sp.]|nr:cobalamin biosynthesis protein P47K [Rhodopirellula sp.]
MKKEKIKFVLVGGFLGAGKTTLVGELAKRYSAQGKRVGIITNDQTENLVDTQNLRSQGFEVGEVSGACFCCSFDDLVATAEEFSADQIPDVVLAEPVGSCTDLVATVILPLQQLLGERFDLAPFGVLLKPSHGKRILADAAGERKSGFSPQAEYIFRKQLEEADYLMIGRLDQLEDGEVAELRERLQAIAEDVPVIPVSPKSGEGVDLVMARIDHPSTTSRRLLDIDYDTYAEGEAELGWVNLTATVTAGDEPIDLDWLTQSVVDRCANAVIEAEEGQIAHLKVSALGGDTQSVANVVSNDSGVDVGLAAGREVTGNVQLIVNARVAMDPDNLEFACRDAVAFVCNQRGLEVKSVTAHSLRPGRPTPTHRMVR